MTDKNTAKIFSLKIVLFVLFTDILLITSASCTSPKVKGIPESKSGSGVGKWESGEQKSETEIPGATEEPAIPQVQPDISQVQPDISPVQPDVHPVQPSFPPIQQTKPIDYKTLKINEAGQVIVVMFHKFVESFSPTATDKGEYTTTFSDFEKLLDTLYGKGYRTISLKEFLDNRIDVPAGYTPIVFTFDDGSYGQFHLADKSGDLIAAERTAVGIMEKFNKKHPDFGLKGVFYLNLGLPTFGDKGLLKDKIHYLISKGYEIGSHTYSHINLGTAGPDAIQKEMGKNVRVLEEITGGYKPDTLALPYGIKSDKYSKFLEKGNFEEIQYENRAILLVGASPAKTPASLDFDPVKIPRVRAAGIISAEGDLKWWLKVMDENPKLKYVSDGDPGTITIPKEMTGKIDIGRLKSSRLSIY